MTTYSLGKKGCEVVWACGRIYLITVVAESAVEVDPEPARELLSRV